MEAELRIVFDMDLNAVVEIVAANGYPVMLRTRAELRRFATLIDNIRFSHWLRFADDAVTEEEPDTAEGLAAQVFGSIRAAE